MKREVFLAVGIMLISSGAEAARNHHHSYHTSKISQLTMVPPPPATSAIPIQAATKEISFKESCALIALDHVMDGNPSITTDEDRSVVVSTAWKLADDMETERCRRLKNP